MKTRNILSILFVTTIVAACGGGGSSVSKEVNPFANGNVPKEKESFRELFTGLINGGTYTFDPVGKKFSFTSDDGALIIEGDYDPVTLTVEPKNCSTHFGSLCPKFGDDNSVREIFDGFEGDGLVSLVDDVKFLGIVGYNPTGKANLPTGRATYGGKFAADVDDGEEYRVRGDAKTIVNFDAGKLSTEFSNFSDERILSAGIYNVSLNGSKFSGGDFKFTTVDGTLMGGTTKVYGEFYGNKGQELGGALNYKYYDDNEEPSFFGTPDVKVEGVWTGKK